MESRGDCFQAVEEYPIGNMGPLGVPENGKPEEIMRTKDNGFEHATKAIVDERHSNNVHGDGETMDLLWEGFETDSEVQSGLKEGGGNNKGYYYYYSDENYDERELNAQLCCIQTLKLTAEKMNLGRGRPKPNLVKKISKGLRWLLYVRTRLAKKWY
ncbi:hypothetical protein V6N12_022894 [Hibiscus sabdariffa]|uniref:Uncharacterized protein n=1 Tax=Hibiscus sabdariffa TaxID=183260 RepID=A0ABR2FW24_9ROSI